MSTHHKLYSLRTVFFVIFSYAACYVYIDQAGEWATYGYGLLAFNPKIYYIEIPLFVLVSLFFFFPSSKNLIARNLLPIVPGLILYSLFDAFYDFFGRMATLSDFANLTDIFSFSKTTALGLIAIYLLIPLSVVLSIKFNRLLSGSDLRNSLLVRLLLVTLTTILIVSPVMTKFQKEYYNYTVWIQEDSIRENGRFNSTIFYSKQEFINQRKLTDLQLAGMTNIQASDFLFKGKLISKKNIHMIVLESFIDPRLILELKNNQAFLAPELNEIFKRNSTEFSHVKSPIYGGGTAQAEFELLTGVKALAKVNQIEFNVMQGRKTNGLLNILESQGYLNYATIAPSSQYFNSKRAYQSLGFAKVKFLEDENILYDKESDLPIFDGDLLGYNLSLIKDHKQSTNKPVFNYVLGMYGHTPFERNLEQRPNVFKGIHENEKLNRIANQFYYRTKAIANYITEIKKIDPSSILVIVSDHLPSILNSEITYSIGNKMNNALFLSEGQFFDLKGRTMYEIPWVIWRQLTEMKDVKQPNEVEMEAIYYNLLSQSLLRDEN